MNETLASWARSAIFAIVTAGALSAAATGCAARTAPDDGSRDPSEEHVAKTDEALIQGGCSMSQIRTLQAGCRDSCSSGSYGIDHCWPSTMTAGANVFLDVSEGGICVCR
jgi:hypothetical protein